MNFFILLLLDFAFGKQLLLSDVFMKEYRALKAKYNTSCMAQKKDMSRIENFLKNKYLVAEHNQKYYFGYETFRVELNQFFDSSEKEVIKVLNGFNLGFRKTMGDYMYMAIGDPDVHTFPDRLTRPPSINWVKKKAVNPVEDFQCCASDYASAALGALEAQLYFKTRKLPKFSVQSILDCTNKVQNFENFGCDGGVVTGTYDYLRSIKGVYLEADYPRQNKIGTCRRDVTKMRLNLTEIIRVGPDDEDQLEIAVARKGPLAVALDASSSLFHFYKSGIYQNPNCTYNYVNHALLLVGYGKDKKTGQNYWLLRNSWGKDWGEDGYMRLLKDGGGECGITVTGYAPEIAALGPH